MQYSKEKDQLGIMACMIMALVAALILFIPISFVANLISDGFPDGIGPLVIFILFAILTINEANDKISLICNNSTQALQYEKITAENSVISTYNSEVIAHNTEVLKNITIYNELKK